MIGFLFANWRLAAIGGAAAGLIFYHLHAVHSSYRQGKADAIAAIEEANRQADRQADAGEDDVARCYRAGGRWMRETGKCSEAVRSDRGQPSRR